MMHTIQEFDARASEGILAAAEPVLRPLRTAYLQHLAIPGEAADLFCTGALLVLDALNTQTPPGNAALVNLVARLSNVTWRIPKLPAPADFFLMASYFLTRPSRHAELVSVLTQLDALSPLLDGDEGLASVLESVTVFVSANILGGPVMELPRLANIAAALHLCAQRVGTDYRLMAAGSDGHMGNQQVVFLRTEGRNTRVYKPRSLTADSAFFTLLSYYNRMLPPGHDMHALPLLAFQSITPWGMQSFVPRIAHPMTDAQAKIYYFQMGELLFLGKLIGLTDAHQDNVIPTDAGPIIIDAECCYQPQVLSSSLLGSTNLFDALSKWETADSSRLASSVFQIETKQSTEVYKRYRQEIIDGFRFARDLLLTDRPGLIAYLLELWKTVDQIRIVPLFTSEFVELFGSSVDTWPEADFLAHSKIISARDFLNGLMDVLCNQHELYLGIAAALARGDIPYCCFRLTDMGWRLMCDAHVLAVADPFRAAGLEAYVHNNLVWLSSNEPEDQLIRALT